VTETITVAVAIERVAGKLDGASKELYHAYTLVEEAEEVWEEKWDEVAEDLKDDLRNAGSSRDPSEHSILSAARRKYRDEYHAWRRAKRAVERAEKVSSNRRAQLSAYQTLFKNFGAEAGVQDYLSQREPT
jgi:hypothetical protein